MPGAISDISVYHFVGQQLSIVPFAGRLLPAGERGYFIIEATVVGVDDTRDWAVQFSIDATPSSPDIALSVSRPENPAPLYTGFVNGNLKRTAWVECSIDGETDPASSQTFRIKAELYQGTILVDTKEIPDSAPYYTSRDIDDGEYFSLRRLVNVWDGSKPAPDNQVADFNFQLRARNYPDEVVSFPASVRVLYPSAAQVFNGVPFGAASKPLEPVTTYVLVEDQPVGADGTEVEDGSKAYEVYPDEDGRCAFAFISSAINAQNWINASFSVSGFPPRQRYFYILNMPEPGTGGSLGSLVVPDAPNGVLDLNSYKNSALGLYLRTVPTNLLFQPACIITQHKGAQGINYTLAKDSSMSILQRNETINIDTTLATGPNADNYIWVFTSNSNGIAITHSNAFGLLVEGEFGPYPDPDKYRYFLPPIIDTDKIDWNAVKDGLDVTVLIANNPHEGVSLKPGQIIVLNLYLNAFVPGTATTFGHRVTSDPYTIGLASEKLHVFHFDVSNFHGYDESRDGTMGTFMADYYVTGGGIAIDKPVYSFILGEDGSIPLDTVPPLPVGGSPPQQVTASLGRKKTSMRNTRSPRKR